MTAELSDDFIREGMYVVEVRGGKNDGLISFAPNANTTKSIEDAQIFFGEKDLKEGVQQFRFVSEDKSFSCYVYSCKFPLSVFWSPEDVKRLCDGAEIASR